MDSTVRVVNVTDVPWREVSHGEHFASASRRLTRGMKLGASIDRLEPGKVSSPFHYHLKEDEFFLVLRGRVMLRHGAETVEVREGDAISCPRGEGGAHQFFNHGDEPAEILMVSQNRDDEVCFYPDSGKWLVRDLGKVGRFEETDYWDGEPEPPLITR